MEAATRFRTIEVSFVIGISESSYHFVETSFAEKSNPLFFLALENLVTPISKDGGDTETILEGESLLD